MGADRTQRLSPRELALKLATRDAVKAAGGQEFVAGETGRAQSRISDYCSPNTLDFMPLEVAAKVEALSVGAPGYPHITRALARAAGAEFVTRQDGEGSVCEDLTRLLADVAGESGDLLRALASGASSGRAFPGKAACRIREMPHEQRMAVSIELDQLVDLLAGIAQQLHHAVEFAPVGAAGDGVRPRSDSS